MAGNSGTVPKQLKPFVKGDPRINRKGRPKSFDQLRSLAQQIAHEVAKAGNEPVIIDGHSVTVAEAIMRQWAQSKNPALQAKFVEVAFGRLPVVPAVVIVLAMLMSSFNVTMPVLVICKGGVPAISSSP